MRTFLVVNPQSANGDTPLHLAAEGNHRDMAHLLLARGASISIVCGVDEQRPALGDRTAAEVAEIEGHAELANYIRGWAKWNREP